MVAGSSPAGRAMRRHKQLDMVGVAQLVEHRIVAPGVVGSIPIVHPISKMPGQTAWHLRFQHADVVKLVDTLDLGSSAARCESSSLSVRTKLCFRKFPTKPKSPINHLVRPVLFPIIPDQSLVRPNF